MEGGYNLHSISRSCEAAVRVLLGEDPVPFPHDFGAYSLSCAFVVDLNVWLAGSLSFCYDSFLFLGGVGLATKEVGVLTSVFSLLCSLTCHPSYCGAWRLLLCRSVCTAAAAASSPFADDSCLMDVGEDAIRKTAAVYMSHWPVPLQKIWGDSLDDLMVVLMAEIEKGRRITANLPRKNYTKRACH